MHRLKINGAVSLKLNQKSLRMSGYKHAIVQVLCSTVMFPEIKFIFNNIPNILDTQIIVQILQHLGAECKFAPPKLEISTAKLYSSIIPEELSEKIHGAIYLFPALLGRFGIAELGKCGGCAIGNNSIIGSRPVEHMLEVLEAYGCKFTIKNNKIIGSNKPSRSVKLDIQQFSDYADQLSGPRVSGATKTAILAAAALASKENSLIFNPYLKPDVTELLRFLSELNYNIENNSTSISISKNSSSLPSLLSFYFISDISTLMTYICMAITLKKYLEIEDLNIYEMLLGLAPEVKVLNDMGINLECKNNILRLKPPQKILPVSIEVLSTSIFSDHQPFFALMLTQADGESFINEKVWQQRFSYIPELNKLGYQFKHYGNKLHIIPGKNKQQSELLYASDLRAAAVLLIAACANDGISYLYGYEHLIRGYDDFIGTLKSCGAEISEHISS